MSWIGTKLVKSLFVVFNFYLKGNSLLVDVAPSILSLYIALLCIIVFSPFIPTYVLPSNLYISAFCKYDQ